MWRNIEPALRPEKLNQIFACSIQHRSILAVAVSRDDLICCKAGIYFYFMDIFLADSVAHQHHYPDPMPRNRNLPSVFLYTNLD
jgi:hypothetical protein